MLGQLDGQPVVAGLGPAQPVGDPHPGHGRNAGLWQWMLLDFGQSVLIKRRKELPVLPVTARPRARPVASVQLAEQVGSPANGRRADGGDLPGEPTEGLELLVEHDFEPMLLARLLEHYARGRYGRARSAEFAILFVEALRERDTASSRR